MIPELELELSKKINKYNCKNIIVKYIHVAIYIYTFVHIYIIFIIYMNENI